MAHGDDDGFWRRWLSHWVTGIVFSVILFFGLKLFEPAFLLRALDRAGSDAVMQGYLPTLRKTDPRIVVVDLGAAPTAKIVAGTLNSVVRAHPKAVGLDLIVVPDLHDDPSKTGVHPVGKLVAALKDSNWRETPIAMPVDNEDLRAALATVKAILPATVELRRDEDGVVRRIIVCREDSASTQLPTLAAGMLGLKEAKCDPSDSPPILFAPVSVPQAGDKSGGIYIVTRETVASSPDILDGSYVLLGTAGRGVESDRFLTPVGELPGVVIHAQSVWTLATLGGANSWLSGERRREWLAFGLDFLAAVLAGACFSIYTAWMDDHGGSVGSGRQALRRFAEGFLGLLWMAAVLIVIGVTWTWLAVSLVSAGVVIGAMSAMFGAMLETLAHVGDSLVRPVHWWVERILKRVPWAVEWTLKRVHWAIERIIKGKTVAVTLTILCIPLAGHAAGCPYRMTVQPPLSRDWSVEPSAFGQHDANGPLQPFDRIVVKRAGTTVNVESVGGSSVRTMTVKGVDTDGGAVLILPPCPPHPGLTSAWDRFWAAMNPRESTQFFGAALISRGLETGEPARQGGPLRDLTNLVPAQGTVIGVKGLALAWVGGSPPYHISIEDEASGAPLGHTQVAVTELWLADWRTPPAPFVVLVTDGQGVALWRHLHPLSPPPNGGDELGDAVALFETAPAYRLEALRRMFIRSHTGDALAARAIALVRVAGAGP